MKKQNLDFKFARDFFVEMKYYAIQCYLKIFTRVRFCVHTNKERPEAT